MLYFISKENPEAVLITGGKQERSRRAGTENVALALGFAYAVQKTIADFEQTQQRLLHWKKQIIDELSQIDEFFISCPLECSVPHILSFGFHGLSAENLLILLDLQGIAISGGSACSSGALEVNATLLAIGFSKDQAKSTMRLSMGWGTTQQDIDFFIEQALIHAKKGLLKKCQKSI